MPRPGRNKACPERPGRSRSRSACDPFDAVTEMADVATEAACRSAGDTGEGDGEEGKSKKKQRGLAEDDFHVVNLKPIPESVIWGETLPEALSRRERSGDPRRSPKGEMAQVGYFPMDSVPTGSDYGPHSETTDAVSKFHPFPFCTISPTAPSKHLRSFEAIVRREKRIPG